MELQKKGRLGEELAVKYLLGKGYQILDRNFRSGRLELDIVASKNDTIYIFEVKSCYLQNSDSPLQRINQQKVNHLYRAAMGYMIARGMTQEFEVLGLSVCVDLVLKKAKVEVVTCGFY